MDIGKLAIQLSINPGNFYSDAQRFANTVQSMSNPTMWLSSALSSIPGPAGAAAAGIAALGNTMAKSAQQGIDFIGEVAGTAKKYAMEIKSANEFVVAMRLVGVGSDQAGRGS